jgi:hypothetical protein
MSKRKGIMKKEEKEEIIGKYLVTFSFATLLFIVGIIIGSVITSQKFERLISMREELKLEMTDLELQGSLGEISPCSNYILYSLGEKLDDLGARLTMLEDQLGKNDPRVIELKKPYTLLLIQHYILIKKRIERCNESYIVILFFYSNKPEFVEESKKQGYVLDYLAKKYGYEKVKVYAIDADLNLNTVKALKEIYNITRTPTTIINNIPYVGFHDKDELEKVFK